jgi:ribonuclease E
VALYVLNHKRAHLRMLEERFRLTLTVSADPTVTGQQSYVIDRGEQVHTVEAAKSIAAAQPLPLPTVDDDEEDIIADDVEAIEHEEAEGPEEEAEAIVATPHETVEERPRIDGEREGGPRRRRRRGRGGRGRGSEPREGAQPTPHNTVPEHAAAHDDQDAGSHEEEENSGQPHPRQEGGPSSEVRRRRRRGRRGGRRNRPRNGDAPIQPAENGQEPEFRQAADSFNRPPTEDRPAASQAEFRATSESARYSPPTEERPAPSPAEYSATTPSAQEPPRRRSTIREPAPFAAAESAPKPTSATSPTVPVVSSTGSEEPATPKRGWWGKRLLGDKG